MERLDGQVVIVTGGARGIGAGIARVLRDEGAILVIADRDASAAQERVASLDPDGANAAAFAVDVTNRDDLAALVAATLERWGRIDILAANAGVYPHIPFAELTPGEFDELMAINLRGAVFSTQACLAPMRDAGYGRIVLTSSITGSIVGQPGYAHYGASKAAMLGFMRCVAVEVADAGITVNAVLPGNIVTPGFGDLGEEHQRAMLAAIPLGMLGEPDDVGWAVRFLASREARYITGQTLVVDGGQVLPESA
ncbi:MAG TPA: glucose 1-dehydrogenase [Solirubrobacteraceae bacterium]|nr:glucose 1-dehydrogenase [Solirubrobacteraceae bacterium]